MISKLFSAKKIARKVAELVKDNLDDILEECILCKCNNTQAIQGCEFWKNRKMQTCPRISKKLDENKEKV